MDGKQNEEASQRQLATVLNDGSSLTYSYLKDFKNRLAEYFERYRIPDRSYSDEDIEDWECLDELIIQLAQENPQNLQRLFVTRQSSLINAVHEVGRWRAYFNVSDHTAIATSIFHRGDDLNYFLETTHWESLT